MGSPNKNLITPPPTIQNPVQQTETAARDALRRNTLRRGLWNTLKTPGGFRGDTSRATVGQRSLIGS